MVSNPTPSATPSARIWPVRIGDTLGAVTASLEDERGVDRRQIRELLALTPAERVDRLVAVVAVWVAILARSGRSLGGR